MKCAKRRRALKPKQRGTLWLDRIRGQVVELLGGRCVLCGCTDKLAFDHKSGVKSWDPSKLSPYVRLLHYAFDIARGDIQLLCEVCNSEKVRDQERQLILNLEEEVPVEKIPF